MRWRSLRKRTPAPMNGARSKLTPIDSHAVTGLMSALAHRDRATAEHSRRVAALCTLSARGLLSTHECYVLEVAALLHDIGKLGVPDLILLKPGPLDETEWSVMRNHEQMGVENRGGGVRIGGFGANRPQPSPVVRGQESRSGPNGGDIPLSARLLSIADAYDAMVSDRPYRKARGRRMRSPSCAAVPARSSIRT